MAKAQNRVSDSWDKIFSKFYVEMDMDMSNPANTTDYIKGYSKKNGYNEAIDPARCLWGFVSRLVAKGYVERTKSILFYTNKGTASELVVELVKNDFRLYGAYKFYLPLETTLKEYYTKLSNGGDTSEILKTYQQSPRTRSKELFEFKQGKFKTEQELKKHCELIADSGFGILRANQFFEEYRQQFDLSAIYEKPKEVYQNPMVTALADKWNANRKH